MDRGNRTMGKDRIMDKDKKGYLVPEDIMRMFKAVEKNISLN